MPNSTKRGLGRGLEALIPGSDSASLGVAQLPVAVYSPNSTGAAAYRALAEELLNADQPTPPASTMTETPGNSNAG